jgi:DNA-binding beta-propeller fold protein YncE
MPKDSALSSPGQLVVDNECGRVLVADTDHHRVVILDLSGQVQHVIGTGGEGRTDAACEETLFRYPRGIAADADFIYVADTGNRIIRRVDRRAHRVTTIAVSGDAGRDDGPADLASFEAPGSLALASGVLYIADGQAHTIRVLDLTSRVVSTLDGPAGSP